jgi:hypothetical protein
MERSRSATVNSKRAALESTKPRFWEGMACENRRNDSRAEGLACWSAQHKRGKTMVPYLLPDRAPLALGRSRGCGWSWRAAEVDHGHARLGEAGRPVERGERACVCYGNFDGAMDTNSCDVGDGTGRQTPLPRHVSCQTANP